MPVAGSQPKRRRFARERPGERLASAAMTGVASTIDRAGLAAALAARGIAVDPAARAVLIRCDGDPARTIATHARDGPVILLVEDAAAVVAALDAGADDALAADAPVGEIAARVAARLRAPPAAAIGVGGLLIDRIARAVTREGRRIALLPREYALLLRLAEAAPDPVPHAELLRSIWGLRFDPGTNVVAVHVSRLRAKVDRGFAQPMLHTAKGVGYALAAG